MHVQRSQESGRGNAENGLVKIMTFFSNPHGRIDPCNQRLNNYMSGYYSILRNYQYNLTNNYKKLF